MSGIEGDRLAQETSETAGRAAEELARTILSSVGEGIIVYDRELRYRLWNPAMEEMTGIREAEVLGRPAVEVFPYLRAHGVDELLARALAGETVRSGDFPFEVQTTGRRGWQRGTFRPHRDEAGRTIGVVGVIHDVTHRKQAQERYRLLAENTPDIILFVRQADGRILEANRAAVGAYGYSRAELLARTIYELRASSTRTEVDRQMAIAGEQGIRFETEHRRRDGTTFPVEVHSQGTRVEGEMVLLSIVRDIAERKRAEAALRVTLADKQTLIQEVHHRARNNLQMLADLLYLQAEATENPDRRAALEESQSRVFAMASLNEQLYKALEHGQVHLGRFFRGFVEAFGRHHSVRVLTALPDDEECHLDANRALHCGLIVNELLTNAVRHAYRAVAAGEIGVGMRQPETHCEVEVWDRGSGLPVETDPAHRQHLGLRLVHLLAKRLEATVEVTRAQGTTFRIRFPLKPY
jgi:PAS domain S-box-containing protein